MSVVLESRGGRALVVGAGPGRAFHRCGAAGVAVATGGALALAGAAGRSVATMAALAAVGVAAFLAVAVVRKAASGGEERLVFYHDAAAVLAAVALACAALGEPVAAYLDISAAALMGFLACGRVGCLLAGCCHGRPARWGVRYGRLHAGRTVCVHLSGPRLLPVQAFEAAAAAALAVGGAVAVLVAPAGTALALVAAGYAAVRLGLELVRGDSVRPSAGGLSEAQWTSLSVAAAAAAGAGAAGLAVAPWLAAVAAGLAAAAALIVLRRRADPDAYALTEPRHVEEIASALGLVTRVPDAMAERVAGVPLAGRDPVHVARTSRELRLSAGSVDGVGHVTLSSTRAPLSDAAARRLAALVTALLELGGAPEVVRRGGFVHVLGRRAR